MAVQEADASLFEQSFSNGQEAIQKDRKKIGQRLVRSLLLSSSSWLIVSQELYGPVV